MKSKKVMLYLHWEVNMAVKSWEVSDEFWARVAPLIPKVKRDPKKTGKLEFFNQGRHNKFRNFSRFAGAVQKNRKT